MSDNQSKDIAFRKQPFWFRSMNKAWKSTYFMGTEIKLEKDDLIKAAGKITGFKELGKDFNDQPLDKLLESVNGEADLSPIGRFITRQRFISLLSIRMRAEHYFKKYPEILELELYPAWFIVGLQRTGTTKLHRLLATDPDHRVIPSWEVINPVPLDPKYVDRIKSRQSAPPLQNDKRIKVARTAINALRIMSPGFFAVHPIDIMQPEEDILLLDVSFLSTTPEAMMNVPTYASWLETTDQSSAYAYMVKLLKFLQWVNPAKRWILKSPHHLEFTDVIAKQFNEVHYLWPHRSIYESVPSFLSMVTYNQMIFCDHADKDRIARHWVRKTGYMLQKALDFRLISQNDTKFTDIHYRNLIKDSVTELEKIYRLDGGLTKDHISRFKIHEQEHPHRKHGVHSYSLGDFNLTEADIDNHTRQYQDFMATL
jgi:hypothetical protein